MAVYFIDGLNNIKALKAMGKQSRFQAFLERKIRSLRKAQRLAVTTHEVRRSLQEVLMSACLCGTLYVSLTVFDYQVSEILVMAVLLSQTMRYLARIQENYQRVAGAEAIHDSFHALLKETRAASERRSGGLMPTLNRGIRFEDVHFAYLKQREVLRGANLEIPVGEITVLTGPSGAGKTTITDLLLGFYDPEQGQVRIDGVPLTEIDIAAWRGMIGFVPQEIVLLHDSVYANVSLGDPKITQADARDALERAGRRGRCDCPFRRGLGTGDTGPAQGHCRTPRRTAGPRRTEHRRWNQPVPADERSSGARAVRAPRPRGDPGSPLRRSA
ncbi:MAG: ABC transporter ATP-binding protein [Rhodospirillales bacterium]|nr:ABC transporter ATP-binding protein [Rhodospirillales bacterium]